MSRTTVHNKIPLSLIFRVPTGSEQNFAFTEAPNTPLEPVEGNDTGGTVSYGGEVTDNEGFLPAPDTFVIVDQQLRRTASGQQVVDVIIDVTDVIGAMEYEVQVTPI